MKIGFDPQKNAKTIRERGLAFEDVVLLRWDRAIIKPDTRKEYGEKRLTAYLPDRAGRLFVVCFTMREDKTFWIISFRKANAREVKGYVEKITHG